MRSFFGTMFNNAQHSLPRRRMSFGNRDPVSDSDRCLRVGLGEGLLMVVKALFLRLVGATHIHHYRRLAKGGC